MAEKDWNLDWLKERLKEAKQNLSDVEKLQKKHPDRFGLKISIDGWKTHIKELWHEKRWQLGFTADIDKARSER